jgi:parallel beta-helix repeat protein
MEGKRNGGHNPKKAHSDPVKYLLLFWLWLVVLIGSTEAATRYIGSTGASSDSWTCAESVDPAKAKRNFNGGSGAIACMASGDTLVVLTGSTFGPTVRVSLDTMPNGTSGSALTRITAQGGPRSWTIFGSLTIGATQGRQWLSVDGFIVDGTALNGGETGLYFGDNNNLFYSGFEVKNTALGVTPGNSGNGIAGYGDNVNFDDCLVHHNGLDTLNASAGYGWYINGTNITIDNCETYQNGGYGLHIFKTTGGAGNITVKNNIIHDNHQTATSTDAGIVVSGGTGHKVFNNVIYGNFIGIQVEESNQSVYNNTVYGNRRSGIYTGPSSSASFIKNNIIVNNNTDNVGSTNIDNQGSSHTFSNNLCNGTGGTGSCNVTGDPLFVNAGTHNFQLSSTASPAYNAGTNLASPYNVDALGVVRPQASNFDIGAYEFVSSAIPVITITGPTSADTYSTSSSTITVSGTSDLAAGIISWSCDRCTPSTGSTTTGTINAWTLFPALTLKAGVNILTVTATATAGGANSDTLTITYTPTFPGNSLVLAMPFEDGSGTTVSDTSGNANTGTTVGTPTWAGTSGGRYGNALTFDGLTQYISVADSNSLDLTQSFSLSVWVKPTQANVDYRSLIAKTATPLGPPYRLFASVGAECGTGGIAGFTRANGVSGPEDYVCHATPLAINVWTHLAVTYDGATLTLYKNGTSMATQVHTGIMEASTGVLYIAASEFGEYFKGLIDELRIYNYAIPRTALSNTVFGNNCTRADQTTTPSVIGDANCPIVAPTPPVIIKIGSSATALQIQGTFKLGSTSGAQ